MDQDPVPQTTEARNEAVREAWNTNAAFWDERMGEGNDFQLQLLSPAIEKLMNVQPGQCVLDAACGNGQLSRRLVDFGAQVVAFDLAPAMVERARARSAQYEGRLEFYVIDATDRVQLRTLGTEPFDALVCNMALMDMADIEPLIEAGQELLKPGTPFVFSVQHPCFNSSFARIVAETGDDARGVWSTEYSLRLAGYKEARVSYGDAMAGQPAAQLYFHRPIEVLFDAFFRAGYALDGLLEPVFPEPAGPEKAASWKHLANIPPVLVARMRRG